MIVQKPIKTDRYGVPIYAANPSLGRVAVASKEKRHNISENKTRAVLYDQDTNIAVNSGAVSIVTREYVDTEKFVKLFATAMPVLEDMSKSAYKVFNGIWHQIASQAGIERVEVTKGWFEINGHTNVTKSVLARGCRELLDKEVIYKSTVPGMYYYNVTYFYNGCRMPALNIHQQYINSDLMVEAPEDAPEYFGSDEDTSGVL